MYTPHKLNISVLWTEKTLWGGSNPDDYTDDQGAAEDRYERMLTGQLQAQYPGAAIEIEKRDLSRTIISVNGMQSTEPAAELQHTVEQTWKEWMSTLWRPGTRKPRTRGQAQ